MNVAHKHSDAESNIESSNIFLERCEKEHHVSKYTLRLSKQFEIPRSYNIISSQTPAFAESANAILSSLKYNSFPVVDLKIL